MAKTRQKNTFTVADDTLSPSEIKRAIEDPKTFIYLAACLEYSRQLPSWSSVVTSPTTAPVPASDNVGALALLIHGAVDRVDRENIDTVMVYVNRLPPEWQLAFVKAVATSDTKKHVGFASTGFKDWLIKNGDAYMDWYYAGLAKEQTK